MTALLFLLVFLGLYPYLVYPVIAKVVTAIRSRPVRKLDGYLPSVTVVTAAFNEARHIEQTVKNKLAQDYPPELLDVLVVSDASVDGTDDIVQASAELDPRVRLIRNPVRQGKTAGLNLAMREVQSDIVVFADANSIYRPDTVRKLVRNFADPDVGYVTGRMLYVNSDGSLVGDGCSAYMKYENGLRALETRLGSIVGVDGGVDAIRRVLYRPMRPDQLPDFVLPLSVVEQGYRVVYEPEAILTEETLGTQSDEYRMRVRVALRAFWALWDKRRLLSPLRNFWFSWQLGSHKLLRYMSFLPLLAAAILNWMLVSRGGIFLVGAVAQAIFALLVFSAASQMRGIGHSSLSRYCYYFFLLNWASAVAFSRFLRGQKQVLWQPRKG